MTEKTLTLFGGTGCHLCDQALALVMPVLEAEGWQLQEINIRGDAELEARYGVRIPVIRTPDGREKGWPFSAGQVRRLVRGE